MRRSIAPLALSALAASLLIAQEPPFTQADVQVQLGDLLLARGTVRRGGRRLSVARCRRTRSVRAQASGSSSRSCGWESSIRAHQEPPALRARFQNAADVAAVDGDALWAYGFFDEAEAAYGVAAVGRRRAGACPTRARPRPGSARPSCRGDSAKRRKPSGSIRGEAEFHYTVGVDLRHACTASRKRRWPSATTST